jgi:DNA-binding transcriptional ArsR family regulator
MNMNDISQRMAALGSATRLEIYRLLVRAGDGGMVVADIQRRLDIPASTLSHHLHRLLRVGLASQERRGVSLVCRADYAVMRETFDLFARECCLDAGACEPRRSGEEGGKRPDIQWARKEKGARDNCDG